MQEAWLRSLEHAGATAVDNSEAWLVTVLRHACIDAARRHGRYRSILEDLAVAGSPLTSETPDTIAERSQRIEHTLRHLAGNLPAGDVAALLLFEAFDFSHADLALLSGRSEAASRQRLLRMLQRLRLREHEAMDTAPPAQFDDGHAQDDADSLIALCRQALVQGDPSALVAVLRASRPQAMALSIRWSAPHGDARAQPAAGAPRAVLIREGDRLLLRIHEGDAAVTVLSLDEAVAERA